jgi:hypothetical protein
LRTVLADVDPQLIEMLEGVEPEPSDDVEDREA